MSPFCIHFHAFELGCNIWFPLHWKSKILLDSRYDQENQTWKNFHILYYESLRIILKFASSLWLLTGFCMSSLTEHWLLIVDDVIRIAYSRNWCMVHSAIKFWDNVTKYEILVLNCQKDSRKVRYAFVLRFSTLLRLIGLFAEKLLCQEFVSNIY